MSGAFEHHVSDNVKTEKPPLSDSTGLVFSDAYNGVSGSSGKLDSGEGLIATGKLPGLDLFDSADTLTKGGADAGRPLPIEHPSLLSETWNVAKELGKGALNEVEHHPLKLIENAAIGLATGTFATPVAKEI